MTCSAFSESDEEDHDLTAAICPGKRNKLESGRGRAGVPWIIFAFVAQHRARDAAPSMTRGSN